MQREANDANNVQGGKYPGFKDSQNLEKRGPKIEGMLPAKSVPMGLPGNGDIAYAPGEVRENSAKHAAEGYSMLTGGPPEVERTAAGGK